MILVDVNLLIDATMTAARDYDAARSWLQGRLAGTARVGLPWAPITGFVRVVGQPRAWERPLPVGGALAVVLLAFASVRMDTGAWAAAPRRPRGATRAAALGAARDRRPPRRHPGADPDPDEHAHPPHHDRAGR